MKNLWDDEQASQCQSDLELRVYSSRLLGCDSSLVLHGGGNTSVKITEKNIFGEDEDILYVKGSGWDLETIEVEGFTPIKLNHLLKLVKLESLSDLNMVNEMKTHQTNASSPTGSVEAILHAALPHKFVDHTHADAIVTITNTPSGESRIRELFGDEVIIVPYVMPGFDLAKLVADQYKKEATDKTNGMVLMNHGMFSFGSTAKESYCRMIDFVSQAEKYLMDHDAWKLSNLENIKISFDRNQVSKLRQKISQVSGCPMILATDLSAASVSFSHLDNVSDLASRGPATPDHVIRTKRIPMINNDVVSYKQNYADYFESYASKARSPVTILDPAPRIILGKELGLIALGKTVKEALINQDIYQHTIEIIQRAEKLEQWQALPAKDIFDVEYWELEQAKLLKEGLTPTLQGEIALVTGAASGIGKACVESLMQQGCAVVGLDIDIAIESMVNNKAFKGILCDVTDPSAIDNALDLAVEAFGGIDILILNAGLFPGGTRIENLEDDHWHNIMSVNLDANLRLMRLCHPLLKRSPRYGRVVVIGSKNFLAPGPGAAAYSSSKAALNQLARVAALEWGSDGIRINSLHPDAVFDTALWTDEILEARAKHYEMTVEAYKTKNILKTEISSKDVAELAAAMCGPLFAKTTASQVPVDGGNDRVI